jgi:hypothetical protein
MKRETSLHNHTPMRSNGTVKTSPFLGHTKKSIVNQKTRPKQREEEAKLNNGLYCVL